MMMKWTWKYFFNFTQDITLCFGTYKQIIRFPVNTTTLFFI